MVPRTTHLHAVFVAEPERLRPRRTPLDAAGPARIAPRRDPLGRPGSGPGPAQTDGGGGTHSTGSILSRGGGRAVGSGTPRPRTGRVRGGAAPFVQPPGAGPTDPTLPPRGA